MVMIVGLEFKHKNRLTTPDPSQARYLQSWMQSVLPTTEVQLEQLGNGVQYCLIMHEYYPNLMPLKRICTNPRSKMDYIANLKLLGEVFVALKWNHIGFDVNRIANNSYQDCINLLAKMHSSLHSESAQSHSKSSYSYSQNNTVQQQPSKSMTIPTYSPINVHKPSPSLSYFPSSSYSKPLSKSLSQQQQQYNFHHQTSTNFKATPTPTSITPMKLQNSSIFSHLGSQSHQVLQDIKKIVSLGTKVKTDREKVRELKIMLGIQLEQKSKYKNNDQQQGEGDKDLLYNVGEHHKLKKASTIVIDNDNDNNPQPQQSSQ